MSKISCFTLIVIIFFQLSCGGKDKAPPPPPIRDFALMNENTVWVVSEKGKVFRLLGEGQKGEEIKFKTKALQIYFLNANEGWILDSDGLIWSTKNSGEDWSQKGKIDSSDVKVLSKQIVFADNQVGWVITAFSIWLTEDTGNSWNEVYPTGDFDYENLKGQPTIFFPVNTDVGWLGMSNNKVLKTANRGKTWENVSPSGEADIYALYCFDENECWVGFGNEGGLSFTSDNGKSWQQMLDAQIRKNLGIKSISFATPQIGWLVAMEYDSDPVSPKKFKGIVLKTIDGGKKWIREKDNFYKNPFEEVKFTDAQNGWIRNKDSVYFTQNGGESWAKIFQLDSVK